MVAMKTTEAATPFYQISQVTYAKTGDSLMIISAKKLLHFA